jgi:hypothetical protein
MLGHVVAQQEVVHRIFERHAEGEALPLLRIALVLVLVGQHDCLAVDVLDSGHDVGGRHRSGAQRHRQRHRGQHVAGVVFAGQRLVARNRPAGGLDHLGIEAVALIEAQRLRHDDRRGAGDRHEADVEVGLFRLAEIVEHGALALSIGKTDARAAAAVAAADQAHEGAAADVRVPEDRADDRAFDARSIISSLDCKLLSSRMPEDDAQAEHPHLAPCLRSALLEKGSFRLLTVIGVSCANS